MNAERWTQLSVDSKLYFLPALLIPQGRIMNNFGFPCRCLSAEAQTRTLEVWRGPHVENVACCLPRVN